MLIIIKKLLKLFIKMNNDWLKITLGLLDSETYLLSRLLGLKEKKNIFNEKIKMYDKVIKEKL